LWVIFGFFAVIVGTGNVITGMLLPPPRRAASTVTGNAWSRRAFSRVGATCAVRALAVHCRSSHTYFSGRRLGLPVLRPAIAHARDQGVEIGAGKLPLEWMLDALEGVFEARQSFGVSTLRGTIEKQISTWLSQIARTGPWTGTRRGWAFVKRRIDASPRRDEPLCMTGDARRAESYGVKCGFRI